MHGRFAEPHRDAKDCRPILGGGVLEKVRVSDLVVHTDHHIVSKYKSSTRHKRVRSSIFIIQPTVSHRANVNSINAKVHVQYCSIVASGPVKGSAPR